MATKDKAIWLGDESGRATNEGWIMQARLGDAMREARQLQRDLAGAVLRLRLERLASHSAYLELKALNAPAVRLPTERRALLTEIVNLALKFTNADMGNIQLFDPTFGALRIEAQCGFTQPFLDFFNQVHHGEAACGTAMKRTRRVIVDDVTQSPIFRGTQALEVILDAGARSVQSTPLVDASGQILGVLSTHRRRPGRLNESELWLLDALAERTTHLLNQLRPRMAAPAPSDLAYNGQGNSSSA
jgi:hypothetical protein